MTALSSSWRGEDIWLVPGLSPVQFGLYIGLGESQPGRAAVDDDADQFAVAFAEAGNAE